MRGAGGHLRADLGLEGWTASEIGDAQLVSEGDAERAYVYSAEIRAVCFVTNPDEDLTAFARGRSGLMDGVPGAASTC